MVSASGAELLMVRLFTPSTSSEGPLPFCAPKPSRMSPSMSRAITAGRASEQRPAVLARDVDGLVLDALTAQKPTGSVLELHAVKNLVIKGSQPLADVMVPAVEGASY